MESEDTSKKRKRPGIIRGDASFVWSWKVESSSMDLKEINRIWKKPRSNIGAGKVGGCSRKVWSSCFSVCPESTERNRGSIIKDHNLDQALGFCEKVMKGTSSEDYLKILKWLDDYGSKRIEMADLKIRIAEYFPSFMDDFDRLVEFYGYNEKKLEEEGITKNYQFLPKDVRGVHNPGATELGKQVLNSWCFCKGSFKQGAPKIISPAEEKLFEREDKLFVRDMLKERVNSIKAHATGLSNKIRDGVIQEPTMEDVNGHFTTTDFRVIAKMYGKEDGLFMLDLLRHKTKHALPILIERLDRLTNEEISSWSLD